MKKKIEEDESIEDLTKYFIKEKSYEKGEKITHTIFNYYYSSDNEKKILTNLKNSEYYINIDYAGKKLGDLWNFIYE